MTEPEKPTKNGPIPTCFTSRGGDGASTRRKKAKRMDEKAARKAAQEKRHD